MAESVVGAIAPQLERAEIERAKRKPIASLDAYDYYLRGLARLHVGRREAITAALPLFRRATELDPEFGAAYGMAAWCYFWRKLNAWSGDNDMEREAEVAEGIRLARLAVELGRDDAVALTRGGHEQAHLAHLAQVANDLDAGIALIDRALLLNPNLAAAWFLGGSLRALQGEAEAAIEHMKHAMRLSPLDPELFRMQTVLALAHFFAGRYDEAAAWAEKALGHQPSVLVAAAIAAASHRLAERADRAALALRQLRALDPGFRVASLREWLPMRRERDLARLVEGLRGAGLPE